MCVLWASTQQTHEILLRFMRKEKRIKLYSHSQLVKRWKGFACLIKLQTLYTFLSLSFFPHQIILKRSPLFARLALVSFIHTHMCVCWPRKTMVFLKLIAHQTKARTQEIVHQDNLLKSSFNWLNSHPRTFLGMKLFSIILFVCTAFISPKNPQLTCKQHKNQKKPRPTPLIALVRN